jgi:hypothetical protein
VDSWARDVSEKHAAPFFRVEVIRVRILMGYVELCGGLAQGAQEDSQSEPSVLSDGPEEGTFLFLTSDG